MDQKMKKCMMCSNAVEDTRFCSEYCMNKRLNECFDYDNSHTKALSK